MMVVKDAMVLIHLSKATLLERSCEFFGEVLIPNLVYEEAVVEGRERNYEDSEIVDEVVGEELIEVRTVEEKELIERAKKFNLQSGEAEAVALYWQEKANLLATDDDNVRKKREILELELVGTPVIVLKLYVKDFIEKEKFNSSLEALRDIGWFSNFVIDKVLERGERNVQIGRD